MAGLEQLSQVGMENTGLTSFAMYPCVHLYGLSSPLGLGDWQVAQIFPKSFFQLHFRFSNWYFMGEVTGFIGGTGLVLTLYERGKGT